MQVRLTRNRERPPASPIQHRQQNADEDCDDADDDEEFDERKRPRDNATFLHAQPSFWRRPEVQPVG
jgi:hypothetical protein